MTKQAAHTILKLAWYSPYGGYGGYQPPMMPMAVPVASSSPSMASAMLPMAAGIGATGLMAYGLSNKQESSAATSKSQGAQKATETAQKATGGAEKATGEVEKATGEAEKTISKSKAGVISGITSKRGVKAHQLINTPLKGDQYLEQQMAKLEPLKKAVKQDPKSDLAKTYQEYQKKIKDKAILMNTEDNLRRQAKLKKLIKREVEGPAIVRGTKKALGVLNAGLLRAGDFLLPTMWKATI